MGKMMILIALFAILTIVLPVLAVFNYINPMVYLLASLALGTLMNVFIIIVFIFTRGILEPALASRLSGKSMWILITATRRFKFVVGELGQRVFATKHNGSYLVDPEASFMFPHGVAGAIAVTSRAVNLQPDMVMALTNAKNLGLKTFKDLEKYIKEHEKDGKG